MKFFLIITFSILAFCIYKTIENLIITFKLPKLHYKIYKDNIANKYYAKVNYFGFGYKTFKYSNEYYFNDLKSLRDKIKEDYCLIRIFHKENRNNMINHFNRFNIFKNDKLIEIK
jgi:hypothetical protein